MGVTLTKKHFYETSHSIDGHSTELYYPISEPLKITKLLYNICYKKKNIDLLDIGCENAINHILFKRCIETALNSPVCMIGVDISSTALKKRNFHIFGLF